MKAKSELFFTELNFFDIIKTTTKFIVDMDTADDWYDDLNEMWPRALKNSKMLQKISRIPSVHNIY